MFWIIKKATIADIDHRWIEATHRYERPESHIHVYIFHVKLTYWQRMWQVMWQLVLMLRSSNLYFSSMAARCGSVRTDRWTEEATIRIAQFVMLLFLSDFHGNRYYLKHIILEEIIFQKCVEVRGISKQYWNEHKWYKIE